ncbi:BrnT family toxin [Arenibaculum sp.]|uniref:BrnT family toxin n=1 Tax=Arenibaculum sp. TaxID=2865862 RepID=UPI002E15F554|nr:BrnT family toxin [Arenibaculum sp.]
MQIEFAPDKRAQTLAHCALDMADAGVVVVWTARGGARRIISMRKANEHEQALYGPELD